MRLFWLLHSTTLLLTSRRLRAARIPVATPRLPPMPSMRHWLLLGKLLRAAPTQRRPRLIRLSFPCPQPWRLTPSLRATTSSFLPATAPAIPATMAHGITMRTRTLCTTLTASLSGRLTTPVMLHSSTTSLPTKPMPALGISTAITIRPTSTTVVAAIAQR